MQHVVLHVETLNVVVIGDCVVHNSVVNNGLSVSKVRGVVDDCFVNNWLDVGRHAMKHDMAVIGGVCLLFLLLARLMGILGFGSSLAVRGNSISVVLATMVGLSGGVVERVGEWRLRVGVVRGVHG